MLLVHKIRLTPNNAQIEYFYKAAGTARFAYNWALAEWERQYEAGGKPSETKLRKQLNAIKAEQFSWMGEVTKNAPQQAIKNLGKAFERFFKKQGGYPKFKKKGKHYSFRADNGPPQKGDDAVRVEGKRIKLSKIGWVKMTEELRFRGQVKSVTVSMKAGRWFAAISVDTEDIPHERKNHGSVGVDLGVKALAVLSTGEVIEGPKAHKKALKRLRYLNKELSRRQRGSGNWYKTKAKLAKLHYRIGCIRDDAIHKLTTDLVLNHTIIGIEDLNVAGMVKNRRLARSVSDQAFGETRRQIEYKSALYGSEVVLYPRFKPSSKLCSVCGQVHDMPLFKRVMRCDCGNIMDRDENAAINIETYAILKAASPAVCGGDSSGPVEHRPGETMPVKQEKNSYQQIVSVS